MIARSDGVRSQGRTVRDLASHVARGSIDGRQPLRDLFGLSTEAMAIALESRGYVVDNAPMI